jgi:23S rRNA pseudouridine1911/1915/1917 synthase
MLKKFYATTNDKGKRLDQYLTEQKSLNLTRNRIKQLFNSNNIKIVGSFCEPSSKIKGGEEIEVVIPPPEEIALKPENIPLDIIFEDSDIIIINKPAGIVVHPGAGNSKGTLVNALLAHCHDLKGIGGALRPGIVHRLDKDTSGLMVVAKNENSYYSLVKQLKDRTLQRKYLALVHGQIKKEAGELNFPLSRHPKNRQKYAVVKNGGREALTKFKVVKRLSKFTLLELELKTGRTHQIRVHTSFIGHPVIGDKKYGFKSLPTLGLSHQALHAYFMKLLHPQSGKEMEFESSLPEDFVNALKSADHFEKQLKTYD